MTTTAASARSLVPPALRRARVQELALSIVVALLVVVGTILKGTIFFSTANLWNVLVQANVAGTVAVGMTFAARGTTGARCEDEPDETALATSRSALAAHPWRAR